MRENSADTKVSEEEGEEASGTRTETALQPMMKTIMKQVNSLQAMEFHMRANVAYEGSRVTAGGDALKDDVTLWGI